ncbi:cell wall hydrolase [Aquamicrobium terrae]
MIAKRSRALLVLCAAVSPVMLAACSQTTHAPTASFTETVSPGAAKTHAYRYTARDRTCLERAMFFESNRSSRDGLVGVGTVVMNRLKSGKHGDTICEVVGEPGQFAPGVLTRKMNSRALPDVQAAAQAVLDGERHPRMKDAMFFHTAGLKFRYGNMHYVAVAGGNAFYEKRGRNWQPLPPDSEFKVVAADPSAPALLAGTPKELQPVAIASAADAPAEPLTVTTVRHAASAPAQQPDASRFGTLPEATPAAPVMTAAMASSEQPAMGFQSTPQNTDAIGALIMSENRPL